VRALAAKVSYVIDPDNDYPRNFSGHIRATLRDGRTIEKRQPHMRGGAHQPLSRDDIVRKFTANVRFGGETDADAKALERAIAAIAAGGSVALPSAIAGLT
jgi:hypothetical protein